MKKIAIVNQRYGIEVNGGSEQYTRVLAEHLKKYYDVDVLTTTARDYSTWKNEYPVGEESVNGVLVKRFPVKKERGILKFRVVSKLVRVLQNIRIDLSKWWVKEQGPYAPELIEYIAKQKRNYAAIIFVTYLYYTTAAGLAKTEEKAILIPTAHDEPYIYYPVYKEVFNKPQSILFLTEEERDLVHGIFKNETIPNDVIASGIDVPETVEPKKFREKYNIEGKYLVYAGRVDYGKNCGEMFRYFEKYKKENAADDIQLVVIGKVMMKVPKLSFAHILGYVSEEDKYNAIAGAVAAWMPSEYESLSLALLEAMALGIPGIVNGKCNVLKGHCEKSGVGIAYRNYEEFSVGLQKLQQTHIQYNDRAVAYVNQNYTWDIVEKKVVNAIENIDK